MHHHFEFWTASASAGGVGDGGLGERVDPGELAREGNPRHALFRGGSAGVEAGGVAPAWLRPAKGLAEAIKL